MGTEAESSVGAGAGAGEEVNVNIRCSNGSKFSVRTNLGSKVGEFKALLAHNCDVPVEQQRLIYKGRILKDGQTLVSYGLQAYHTVHMVRGSAPAATLPTVSAGNANRTPGVTEGSGPNERGTGTDLGAPHFPGPGFGALGGNRTSGLFRAGFPEFEQVQQQLTQNPNTMREMMNMPAIQSVMNNPDIMRSLIMSNPQMREIIDRNPELAHILNDPSILRQTLETARNPELLREMMRNTDRAMSNIESSPEGFNMLRRMYEDVQEPFLNATTMGAGATTDLGSNPFAALLGNQGGGDQTGDGSNRSTTGSETTMGAATPNTNPLPNPWNNSSGGSQTHSASRANQTANARPSDAIGLGGLGLPELERMVGMPDPSLFNQLLQNPAMGQMMQSLLSNPQYMEQILGFNPQLRSILDTNPQLREMMQNPEILRQLTSPVMMQQMMELQQQISQFSWQQSTPGAQTGQVTGTQNNMGLDLLMNMFGGLGAGSLTVPNTPSGCISHTYYYYYFYNINFFPICLSSPGLLNMPILSVFVVPPEELYATQLSQLQEMGFFDTQENIRALRATSGNVHAAVERLLGNLR